MRELIFSGGGTILLILFLLVERRILLGRIRKIPLRICVAGTRGKSSVTRLIASAIREQGIPVLAKTTGSKPCLILPDGSEKEIRRRGNPTILEAKKVLRACTRVGIQAVVFELMSITPESLWAESVQMIQPHILVITNVRIDHTEQMGGSRDEIARGLAASFPEECIVFILEGCFHPLLRERAESSGVNLVSVPENFFDPAEVPRDMFSSLEFSENICLALAVADYLEIERKTALRGMSKAHSDFGSLKVWKREWGSPPITHHYVSAFAANDPESTQKAFSKLRDQGLFEGKKVIGLLNLRGDRGDRTVQWKNTLERKGFFRFDRILVFGEHAEAFLRRIKEPARLKLQILDARDPAEMMSQLSILTEEEAVFVGMGNMGGAGKLLVEFWERIGDRSDI